MAKKKSTSASPKSGTSAARTPESGAGKEMGAAAPHPVAGLRSEIDRAFERFFRDPWGSAWMGFPSADGQHGWQPFVRAGAALNPSAQMKESDEGFELSVELPGLDEGDIELTVTDGALTLKGEKREETTSDEGESHFSERRYGSFRRTFALPPGVDPGAVKASFAKGVLAISMPKSAEAKSAARRISVDAP